MRFLRGIHAAAICLALSQAWAQAGAQARLEGRILKLDGSTVVGAEIFVAGTRLSGRSDSAGRFSIDRILSGPIRFQARALGFAPLDTTITIPAGQAGSIILRMTQNVQQLAPVVTEAALPYGKPERYRHTGRFDDFYERRARRPGTFFTREDIERSGRNYAMELMSTVPGVTLNWRNGSAVVRVARCTATSIFGAVKDRGDTDHSWLAVFINGQRVGEGGIGAIRTLAELRSDEIETMEVYRGPSQLPLEAVGNSCAAVFITTRYTTGSVLPSN